MSVRRITPKRRVRGKLIAAAHDRPPAHGWGDKLARALARWVTNEDYRRWKVRWGFANSCGCAERQEKLNAFGRYVGQRVRAAWRALRP